MEQSQQAEVKELEEARPLNQLVLHNDDICWLFWHSYLIVAWPLSSLAFKLRSSRVVFVQELRLTQRCEGLGHLRRWKR